MKNPVPPELGEYLRASDPSFAWTRVGGGMFSMTSQRWQGIPWLHAVSLSEGEGDLAVLSLTGGDPNELDLAEQDQIAKMSGMPVATLFHVPNQPIFDLWEDDLIAHTFDRFLETGDPTWPMLLPMVKSAVRAMDVIQEATNGRISRFLVTGLSKRGWTTWLTAASGDPRIAGIAPMVIDNLNVAAQMKHQIETWGRYSEMIEAYTTRGLQEKVETTEGGRLAEIVDPFAYRGLITVPTLIVNGSNDPYWQVDALSLYWEHLQQPKWASIVPNAGHLLGDQIQRLEVLNGFAQSLAGRFPMPAPTWSLKTENGCLAASVSGADHASVWRAESATLDFRESEWKVVGAGKTRYEVPLDPSRNVAALLATRHAIEGVQFTLTSPVSVFPSRRR